MFLKAAFKNAPSPVQLLMILAVIALGTIFSLFLSSLLIISKMGMSPEVIEEVRQNLINYPEIIRGIQFLQTLGIFLFPSIVCAWLFSDNYKEYLKIDQPIRRSAAVWTIIGTIVAVPFLNWTYFVNQQMVFPEALKGVEAWMNEAEKAANRVIDVMLDTKSISAIIFNFLVICVIAGVSEEFMFRGLLQTSFGRIIRNQHVLIWTIAILFSAIHFQFYGFITRLILGAWLGYLMYYTKTIWIPALAHFTNNILSIGMYYLFRNTPGKTDAIDAIGTGSTWWLAAASFALFFFCFFQIKKTADS